MICPFQNHVLDCSFKLLVLWPRLYLQRCWEGLGKESLYFPFMNLPRIEHKGLEVQGYIEAFWSDISCMKGLTFSFTDFSKWSYI